MNPRPKTHPWELLRAQTVIAEVLLFPFPAPQASRHAQGLGKLHTTSKFSHLIRTGRGVLFKVLTVLRSTQILLVSSQNVCIHPYKPNQAHHECRPEEEPP